MRRHQPVNILVGFMRIVILGRRSDCSHQSSSGAVDVAEPPRRVRRRRR